MRRLTNRKKRLLSSLLLLLLLAKSAPDAVKAGPSTGWLESVFLKVRLAGISFLYRSLWISFDLIITESTPEGALYCAMLPPPPAGVNSL